MGKNERRVAERALIRLSAIDGGTPPAQGGGWGWWSKVTAPRPLAVRALLKEWFTDGHQVREAMRAAAATALAPAPEDAPAPT